MKIEIDVSEDAIKAELDAAVAVIVKKTVTSVTSGWGFENTVRGIALPMITAAIQEAVAEELKSLDTVKNTVKEQMVKSAKSQYNKALKLM